MGPKELEINIDKTCNELKEKIEKLQKLFKIVISSNNLACSVDGEDFLNTYSRERDLKKTMREAAAELEETKRYFKSKTIGEVREKLIKAIE